MFLVGIPGPAKILVVALTRQMGFGRENQKLIGSPRLLFPPEEVQAAEGKVEAEEANTKATEELARAKETYQEALATYQNANRSWTPLATWYQTAIEEYTAARGILSVYRSKLTEAQTKLRTAKATFIALQSEEAPTLPDHVRVNQELVYPPSSFGGLSKINELTQVFHHIGDQSDEWNPPLRVGSRHFSEFMRVLSLSERQLYLQDTPLWSSNCEKGLNQLIRDMRVVYASEDGRRIAFREAWRVIAPDIHLDPKTLGDSSSVGSKAGVDLADKHFRILFEIKNNWGMGSSDPSVQGLAYSILLLSAKDQFHERLLVCLTGQVIAFFGFAYNSDLGNTALQPLGTVVLIVEEHRDTLRNLFAALIHFSFLVANEAREEAPFHSYPNYAFRDLENSDDSWKWLPKKPVAFNSLHFVKFSERYGIDAHQHFERSCKAPKLIGFTDFEDGLRVVLKNIGDDYVSLWDALYNKECGDAGIDLDSVAAEVKVLKEWLLLGSFVHGDLRSPNLMIRRSGADPTLSLLQVVDFDWAGAEGDVHYPPLVGTAVTDVVFEAGPGILIKKQHDQQMLDSILRLILEFNSKEEANKTKLNEMSAFCHGPLKSSHCTR